MEVLQSKSQIAEARRELERRGLSFTDSALKAGLRRLRIAGGVAVGDFVKSWDVLLTLRLIENSIEISAPVLDIGCYASEAIVALHRLGYLNLTGVDLNVDLKRMPYANSIRYVQADFLHTEFPDSSFQVITSISVIEHGYQGPALLSEMSRLLKPGGYFIASFDYWPEKIDTTGVKFFGMDWRIFSSEDVQELIREASKYGLIPDGELRTAGKEKAIECGGRKYTFGWLVLKKTSPA